MAIAHLPVFLTPVDFQPGLCCHPAQVTISALDLLLGTYFPGEQLLGVGFSTCPSRSASPATQRSGPSALRAFVPQFPTDRQRSVREHSLVPACFPLPAGSTDEKTQAPATHQLRQRHRLRRGRRDAIRGNAVYSFLE